MTLAAATANLACRDIEASIRWYADLFDRGPDERACATTAEWREAPAARFRLVRDLSRAGKDTLTIRIAAIGTAQERVAALVPGVNGDAGPAYCVHLRDPDGNLVVLTGA
ncbi:MAG: VOC family protein [Pseudooceanicola sp.]